MRSYFIYMYAYGIRVTVVWTRMSSVCHSHVLECHPYITHMYSYAIRMSLVYTRMSSVCHLYVVLPWTIFKHVFKPSIIVSTFSVLISEKLTSIFFLWFWVSIWSQFLQLKEENFQRMEKPTEFKCKPSRYKC